MSECGTPDGTNQPILGGKAGINQGDDPTRELQPYDAECAYGGTVPDGVDGTDTENWAD